MPNTKLIIGALTDMGNIRKNNEDNFTVIADLVRPDTEWGGSKQLDLGERGSLLVVADGMGGMNAGEVASAIAVSAVEDMFKNMKPEVLRSTATIQNFMSSVVVEADKRIKSQSTLETRGMGTTIVMAWLYNDYAYVCWCGDSRAYLFNTAVGLRRISKDHSLVQSLVDNHKITDDEAFDSPQSNIITRCLSDSQNNAKPENAEPVELSNGDVIMLCSDGLCGMIRDRDIVQIMRNKIGDGVVKTVDELVAAAKRAGGKDNVTVVAASITNDKDPVKVHAAKEAPLQREPSANAQQMLQGNSQSKPAWMWALIGALVMVIIGLLAWILFFKDGGDSAEQTDPQDTVRVEETTDVEEQQLPVQTQTQPAANTQQPEASQPTTSTTPPEKTNPTKPDSVHDSQTVLPTKIPDKQDANPASSTQAPPPPSTHKPDATPPSGNQQGDPEPDITIPLPSDK